MAARVLQKRGEAVAYQGRKKAKTRNILPVTDGNGYIIATTGVIAGNHNDSYLLEQKLKQVFADMQRCGLDYKDAVCNMDSSFDTRAARKLLWNRGVKLNFAENKRTGRQSSADGNGMSPRRCTTIASSVSARSHGSTHSRPC